MILILKRISNFSTPLLRSVIGNDCDPMNLQNTYQEICDNPFYYIDPDISLDGTVVYENCDADSAKLTLLYVIKKVLLMFMHVTY